MGVSRPGFRKGLSLYLGTMHLMVDQVLRYWVQARVPLSRQRIVICDRYRYDAVVTPVPRGLAWTIRAAVRFLVPRPDRIIVLTSM